MHSQFSIKRYLKWTVLSSISGLLSGLAATIFLVFLDVVTRFRETHNELIWFLPVAGFGIGWLYFRFGKDIAGGHNLILDEIHDPKKVTPFRIAPFILLGTITTHLFGGSAGREGTAVQMARPYPISSPSFFGSTPRSERSFLFRELVRALELRLELHGPESSSGWRSST